MGLSTNNAKPSTKSERWCCEGMLRGSFWFKHAPQSLVRRGDKMNAKEHWRHKWIIDKINHPTPTLPIINYSSHTVQLSALASWSIWRPSSKSLLSKLYGLWLLEATGIAGRLRPLCSIAPVICIDLIIRVTGIDELIINLLILRPSIELVEREPHYSAVRNHQPRFFGSFLIF